MELYNLISFAGIFLLLGFAWMLSTNRRIINWHLLAWGIGLQMLFGLFIFVVPAGAKLFLFINGAVVKMLDSASAGTRFVFGPLAVPPGVEGSLGFILAFQGLPAIIFFSALMAILYFLNIMPKIVKGFAYIFTRLMKVSGAESLCAASNIFVGIESAFTVRPHLGAMTRSELCTVLAAGMATVASNVMALYVFTLQNEFPTIAGHLISASLLSAPAALIMSKMLLPESQKPLTLGEHVDPHYKRESNLFEAIINGAQNGVKVILGIVALLIAVLGLVALVDLVLNAAGVRVNRITGLGIDWSLSGLLGYLFYPFTLIIGVPPSDAWPIARLIGQRLVVTEVASYQDLAVMLSGNALHHGRSAVITAYALCGFAHLASMAIFIGGIAAIVPERVKELTQVGFRALLAATLACLMTACIAGAFFSKASILIG